MTSVIFWLHDSLLLGLSLGLVASTCNMDLWFVNLSLICSIFLMPYSRAAVWTAAPTMEHLQLSEEEKSPTDG